MYLKFRRKPLTKGRDLVLLVPIFTCCPNFKVCYCFCPSQTSPGYTLSTTDFVLPSLFPTLARNSLIDLGFLRIVCILRCCKLHSACSSVKTLSDHSWFIPEISPSALGITTVFSSVSCLPHSLKLVTDFKMFESPSCYLTRGTLHPNLFTLYFKTSKINPPQLQGTHLITSPSLPPKQLS